MENDKVIIPAWVIECAVTDCNSVVEFAHKYRKPERFTGRGQAYVQAVMESHIAELIKQGYTVISHHDNISGRIVAYLQINSKQK